MPSEDLAIGSHMPQPPVLQNPREQLAHLWGSAIGRMFPGDDGTSCAELSGMSLIAATFHDDGTLPSMITLLNRSRRAGRREGHFLKIR